MTQKVLRVLGPQTHILFTLGRIDHMYIAPGLPQSPVVKSVFLGVEKYDPMTGKNWRWQTTWHLNTQVLHFPRLCVGLDARMSHWISIQQWYQCNSIQLQMHLCPAVCRSSCIIEVEMQNAGLSTYLYVPFVPLDILHFLHSRAVDQNWGKVEKPP